MPAVTRDWGENDFRLLLSLSQCWWYSKLQTNCSPPTTSHLLFQDASWIWLIVPLKSLLFFIFIAAHSGPQEHSYVKDMIDRSGTYSINFLLCASHLSLSSSHRLGFFSSYRNGDPRSSLERLVVNLVLSLVSEISTRFRLCRPQ